MPRYCTIRDLRDEGVTLEQASDARLRRLIEEASETIDGATGWFFEPRSLVLRLDGRGTPSIEPPFPPISLVRITAGFEAISLDPEDLLVVGAPVAPGFVAPRIARVHGIFQRGYGNVVAVGMWGYTEPDGSVLGRTPLAIRRACMLLVMRMLPRLGDTDAADEARNRWRILAERTQSQSYTLAPLRREGELTGDIAIDDILARYMRPAGLGAA